MLTEAECRAALERGDFTPPAPGAAAIILTQSWCPQWQAMKNYLKEVETAGTGVEILFVEYDTAFGPAFFEDFVEFKENTFQNREIPYVRYFRDGTFTGDSNYVSAEGFIRRLEL